MCEKNFNIELRTLTNLEEIETVVDYIKTYSDELDDERSVIEDICEIFEDTKKIKFFVSGFGDKEWYVECRIDLAVIIEQIPEIISKIRNENYSFNLDFYEQGVERKINFIPDKQGVTLECISRSKWIPKPEKIRMKKEEIANIFEKLFKDFLLYGEALCSDLINNNLFRAWVENTLNSNISDEILREE